jgi:hypothetical protein
MAQTICNSPKTEYSPPFKMKSNSNGIQFCPNHFLVGDNIALQYLGQLPHFSKLPKCPKQFRSEVKKRNRNIKRKKGRSFYCALRPANSSSQPNPPPRSSPSFALSPARADTAPATSLSIIRRLLGVDKTLPASRTNPRPHFSPFLLFARPLSLSARGVAATQLHHGGLGASHTSPTGSPSPASSSPSTPTARSRRRTPRCLDRAGPRFGITGDHRRTPASLCAPVNRGPPCAAP